MSVEDIKRLREMTSRGINECKKALADAGENFDGALKLLRERGAQVIDKKSGRSATQGLVESYVHHCGNLGALVEINCETDFVARTDSFKKFVKDIAMHIAASAPVYVKKEDIPPTEAAGTPNIEEYAQQCCLMNQAYVKDAKITVGDYLKDMVAQTGENIVIKRFMRFSLGE